MVIVTFKALPQHSYNEAEENHKVPVRDLIYNFLVIILILKVKVYILSNKMLGRAMAQVVSCSALTTEAMGTIPAQCMWCLWWTK